MTSKIPTDLGRDPAYETWLDSHHVTWTFTPTLDLDTIDIARSLANQARIGEPLDEDTVDRYQLVYSSVDPTRNPFPPLLAHKPSSRSKRLTLLGGNHRNTAAQKAGHRTHPAYIIECEPETALLLMYEDNLRHGLPPKRADRIRQAIHLIETGWQARAAAAALGVGEAEVSNARKVNAASTLARKEGVTGFDELPAATRLALARINSTPVFAAAAQLAADAKLSAADAGNLAQRANKAGSDQAGLEVVAGELDRRRTEIQATAKGRVKGRNGKPANPYAILNGLLVHIVDADPATVAASIPTTDAAAKLRDRLKRTAAHLMAVDKAVAARGKH